MPQVSAGILLFRRMPGQLSILLGHPGGPMWQKRDDGAWTIPKGLVNQDEDLLLAAQREFKEETSFGPQGPFISLGSIRLKSGKTVHAWATEGDCDPATLFSNTTKIQWPPRSGKYLEIPELDRFGWFSTDQARVKLNPAQAVLIDRLINHLNLTDKTA